MARLAQCCCCSLKTGSIIIGFLWAIRSVLNIVIFAGAVHFLASGDELSHDEDGWKVQLLVISIVVTVIFAMELVISILLLTGAFSENPKLIRPWIVWAIICEGLGTVLGVVNLLLKASTPKDYVIGFIKYIFNTILVVYLILVVHSYYTEIITHRIMKKRRSALHSEEEDV